jgi:hypothetical protein
VQSGLWFSSLFFCWVSRSVGVGPADAVAIADNVHPFAAGRMGHGRSPGADRLRRRRRCDQVKGGNVDVEISKVWNFHPGFHWRAVWGTISGGRGQARPTWRVISAPTVAMSNDETKVPQKPELSKERPSKPDSISAHPLDPVQENPFPPGDSAHAAWETATRQAEAELFTYQAEMLQTEHPTGTGRVFANWYVKLFLRTVQIWAKRGLSVVRTFEEARAYERWLHSYAENWLNDARPYLTRKMMDEPELVESVLIELHAQLIAIQRHWAAGALVQVSAIETKQAEPPDQATLAASASATLSGTAETQQGFAAETPPSAQEDAGPVRRPTRSAWLQAEMDRLGIDSSYAIQKAGGPRQPTVDRILNNRPVKKKTLSRLLRTLNRLRFDLDRDLPSLVSNDIPDA